MGLPLKITILSLIVYIISISLLFRYDPTGHFNFGSSKLESFKPNFPTGIKFIAKQFLICVP